MKKIYLSTILIAFSVQLSDAQLSLTKAINEPLVGDINQTQDFDSTSAVPKTIGAGQNWNFNSFTAQTSFETNTYTTVASTPSASAFPGADLAEYKGSSGDINFYNVTPANFEVQGLQFPGTVINFSNTAIFYTWPVNFGYNVSDAFGGSTTTASVTTTMQGNVNVNGSGTGTVTMPGGIVLNNCLQLVSNISFTLTQGSFSLIGAEKEYTYFHSSNKFPIIIMKYKTETTGTVVTKSFEAKVNTAVFAGITSPELNFDFSVFPNPATESINVSLVNVSNLNVSATLINMLGQIIKTQNLGNDNLIRSNFNIADLPKGLYFMNVKIGEANSVKKIVIE